MADSSLDSVVGRIGWVVTRISGTDRPGEITLQIRGGTEAFVAYADGEIGTGTSVVVIGTSGPLSVVVTPLLG